MRLSPDKSTTRPDPNRVPELPFHRLKQWGSQWFGCHCGAMFPGARNEHDAERSQARHLREVLEREKEIRAERAPWL